MITVFKTIAALFENQFSSRSKEFNKGFSACFELFKIGYEKTPMFNQGLEIARIKKQLQNTVSSFEKLLKDERTKVKTLQDYIVLLPDNSQLNGSVLKRKLRLRMYVLLHNDKPAEEIVKELQDLTSDWGVELENDSLHPHHQINSVNNQQHGTNFKN